MNNKNTVKSNNIANDMLSLNNIININDNSDLPHIKKDKKQLDDRNKIYTEILNDYKDYIKDTITYKNKYKGYIVIGFSLLLILLIIGSFCIIKTTISLKLSFENSVLPLITAISTLFGSLLIIPQKITDYLFNSNEMGQISDVIGKIQEYDKAVRDDLQTKK